MNNALTGISIAKGFTAIIFATAENSFIQKAFPFVETTINIAWNVPVIMNIYVNYAAFDTTYKSLIPENRSEISFNFGGMIDLPIALIGDVKVKLVLIATQNIMMDIYGDLMVIAAGSLRMGTGPVTLTRRG